MVDEMVLSHEDRPQIHHLVHQMAHAGVIQIIFTATCFSNVAVMGSLDVRPSVCNVGDS